MQTTARPSNTQPQARSVPGRMTINMTPTNARIGAVTSAARRRPRLTIRYFRFRGDAGFNVAAQLFTVTGRPSCERITFGPAVCGMGRAEGA